MSNLRSVLAAVIIDAHKAPDHKKHTTLSHGLRIGVRLDSTTFTLWLARQGRSPSVNEWSVVLGHLNASYLPATDARPAPISTVSRDGAWQYLYAIWTPRKEIEFL